MHNPIIEQAARDYLELVDTRPVQAWTRGEVQRHLVAFTEHHLATRACPYCKGSGTIEVEIHPGGSYDEALCPCGHPPVDHSPDKTGAHLALEDRILWALEPDRAGPLHMAKLHDEATFQSRMAKSRV